MVVATAKYVILKYRSRVAFLSAVAEEVDPKSRLVLEGELKCELKKVCNQRREVMADDGS